MVYETIKIWEENYQGDIKGSSILQVYIQENLPSVDACRKRAAVLICPGGGYSFISEREKEPVAMKFMTEGFAAFTLDYEVAPQVRHPRPLLDISRAMWIIRENAERWHIDPDKIAVCGFSAGGHLAASLGVLWSEESISRLTGMPEGINRPNAMILCYPVITAGEFAHRDSFEMLLGASAAQEDISLLSLEKRVNEATPPAFIWHTFEDSLVPVENSLLFAWALRKKGIPFDLHIYSAGDHGLSLGSAETARKPKEINPHAGSWFHLSCEWLRGIFGL